MNREGLDAFVREAGALGVLNVVALRGGEAVFERHFQKQIRYNNYSIAKSFTALAVGLAEAEGLLSLDERLLDCFPEEAPPNPGANLMAVTVRDLLTMCLGQDEWRLSGAERLALGAGTNWAEYALGKPFPHPPGEVFLYNNVGPFLAALIVQRRVGQTLVDYLLPRLFEPLGIWRPTWEVDPNGLNFGAGGLFLAASELAKVGQLLLQGGEWEGRQLIPRAYVREATRKQVDNPGEKPDYNLGYGYLFWRGRLNSFRAEGKNGQFILVFPDEGMVVAVQSFSNKEREILRCVYERLMPEL
jgi:CubicO group peptidase (beta-lactamase class C family)